MLNMFVTLEVSKLSGWLNALAFCRVSKEGRAMRGEVQTGRPEVAGDRGARSVQERARPQIGSRAQGGAHFEHEAHVCDAGGFEAQRLVERPRPLPSRKRGYDEGRRRAGGGGTAWGGSSASGIHRGGGDCRLRVQGTRGAHEEHGVHVRDARRVEGQRLVEHHRGLPSRKQGVRCGARCGPRTGGCGPAAAHTRHARREGPAVKAGRARGCAERT